MTFAALLLLAAFADPSPPAGPSAAAPAVQAEAKKERKVCKRLETSESRLGATRVCKTAAEWREEGSNVDLGVVQRAGRGAN